MKFRVKVVSMMDPTGRERPVVWENEYEDEAELNKDMVVMHQPSVFGNRNFCIHVERFGEPPIEGRDTWVCVKLPPREGDEPDDYRIAFQLVRYHDGLWKEIFTGKVYTSDMVDYWYYPGHAYDPVYMH